MTQARKIEGLERAPGGRRERGAGWGFLSLAAVAAILAAVLL